MIIKRPFLLPYILLTLAFTASNAFSEIENSDNHDLTQNKWAVTLFNGIYTARTFGKTTFNIPGHFESNYIHGLSVSREFWKTEKHFSWELESMFAKHHGQHKTGYQNYEEYVLAVFLRYHTFPWDNFIDTSIAIGEGLSLTSKIPERESQRDQSESRHLLNYLAIEFAFTLPKYPNTSLVYRIHHRSGVFGLFGGVKGASDFYMLGLRYNF